MSTPLNNTVAVVTGAASGIGRATALHLARDGFDVAMMDLDPVGLAATHDQIKACGGQARSFAVDLCDPLEVGSVTREIAVTIGSPEVLVNVAGIGVAATVLETSDEDWNRVLAVNLTGPFLTTRAILPLMLDRGNGVIVNIASVAGQVGVPRRAAVLAPSRLSASRKRAPWTHAHEASAAWRYARGPWRRSGSGKIPCQRARPRHARGDGGAAYSTDGWERRGRSPPWSPFVVGPAGRFINRNSPHRRWRDDGEHSAATVRRCSAIGPDLARIGRRGERGGTPDGARALPDGRHDRLLRHTGGQSSAGQHRRGLAELRWANQLASRWCSRAGTSLAPACCRRPWSSLTRGQPAHLRTVRDEASSPRHASPSCAPSTRDGWRIRRRARDRAPSASAAGGV